MAAVSRDVQVFVKPAGALCNMACRYCYYLDKRPLAPPGGLSRMPDNLLEQYIVQQIDASPSSVVTFSWHGGEPTVLGLDFFRRVVELQRRHRRPGRRIVNGIQTNGLLIDETWSRFFRDERFRVGLSLDGPADLHDPYRVTRSGEPTHAGAMRAFELLQRHGVACDILCVVHDRNVREPIRVYRFFRRLGARSLVFLPLVEPVDRGLPSGSDRTAGVRAHSAAGQPDAEGESKTATPSTLGVCVSERSVLAGAYGTFLCTIFDEWVARDANRIAVQIFDEATRPARGLQHSLCIFREICGDVPIIERNGDVYCCDHYVDAAHRLGNIRDTPLVELIESPAQQAFGQAKQTTLPQYCRACEVRLMCNGGCPKDRLIRTPDGEEGLNYLCAGFKRFFAHVLPYAVRIGFARLGRAGGGGPAVTSG